VLVGFQPAGGAQAPPIARLYAWKAPLRMGCAEVIAGLLREGQELLIYESANGMQAPVLGTDVAPAIPEETGDRIVAAAFKRTTEYVARCVKNRRARHNSLSMIATFEELKRWPNKGSAATRSRRRTAGSAGPSAGTAGRDGARRAKPGSKP
jgi:hypothetical protein